MSDAPRAASRRETALPDRILRASELYGKVGLSMPSVYRKIKDGEFPRPVQLGPNSVGWRETALDAWIASLPEAAPEAPSPKARGRRPAP